MRPPVVRKLRCAVYTRRSSEEGLEMEFNSLHAQREACEAYVVSQKAEGWLLVPDRYDDGGFSGGNIDRPALKRLLADIEAGRVDVIVVYKIDRLSRSLMDFARLVEVFDRKGVTFVSVTQSFNTTTSMGRLTLNVLLSFAQFEREVIGERIRDKFAASRKKGCGWAAGRRWATGSRTGSSSSMRRRRHWSAGSSTASPPGEHQPLVARSVWDRVQAIFASAPRMRAGSSRAQTPALLKGLLFGPTGCAMTPTHTRRGGKLYRYYVSQATLKDREDCPIRRVPAGEIETAVLAQVRRLLIEPEVVVAAARAARARDGAVTEEEVREALHAFTPLWDELFPAEQARIVHLLVERVDLGTEGLDIRLRVGGLADLVRETWGSLPAPRRAA